MVDDFFFSFYLLSHLIVYADDFHTKHVGGGGAEMSKKTLLLAQKNRS